MSGEEGMYKPPISTIFVSPLSGPSRMEICPVCTIDTEYLARHPLGTHCTTDLYQTSMHRLKSSSGDASSHLCRVVAVTRLLGVWKSLAIG